MLSTPVLAAMGAFAATVPPAEALAFVVDPSVVAALSGVGVLGMLDFLRDEEDGGESGGDGGDALGGGGDALGDDLDDSWDEGLDGMEGDAEFGGDDDGFGMEEESSTAELETRLDELEEEVGQLSSSLSTVRSENEEISETVDDIEENMRKLLDIYEMVTKGVNPFVDDVQAGGAGFDDGGGFDLFGGDEEDTVEETDLDESVADADAESFFDDDALDDGEDDAAFDDADEVDFDSGGLDDGLDAPADDGGEGDDDGKSFAELKDEYESGDAEWADGESEDDDAEEDATSDDVAIDSSEEPDGESDDGIGGFEEFESAEETAIEEPTSDPGATAEATTDESETDDADDAHDAAESETVTEPDARRSATVDSDVEFAENTVAGSGGMDARPYLTQLPDGYAAEALVLEWVEYLVAATSPRGARRAIRYYEDIGWVGAEAAADLREYLPPLTGMGGADGVTASDGGELAVEQHLHTLAFVAALADDPFAALMERRLGGGRRGV